MSTIPILTLGHHVFIAYVNFFYDRIETPSLNYSGVVCLSFYANMYSTRPNTMGSLEVFRSVPQPQSSIFSISGNQGPDWFGENLNTTIENGEKVGKSVSTTVESGEKVGESVNTTIPKRRKAPQHQLRTEG